MFKPVYEEETDKYKQMQEKLQADSAATKSNVADLLGLDTLKVDSPTAKRERDSVKCYDVDVEAYSDLIDQAPKIQDNIKHGLDEYKGFESLNQDLYMSLYKYQPFVHAKDSMKDGFKFNNEMTRNMIESESYDKLRQATAMNDVCSLIGTEALSNEVLTIIRQYKQENQEAMDKMNQMIESQDGLDNANGQLQSLQDMADQNGGQLTPDLENFRKDLQQQQQNMQQQIDDLSQDLQNMPPPPGMANAMNQAVQNAADEAEEAGDIMNSWLSGSDPGQLQRIPYEQKKAFIEKVRKSKKLKDMADLVGRFKATAIEEQKRKTKEYGHTIEDVKTGNKLEKILGSEKMKLKNDITRGEFMKRYNEKALLEYETINNIKKNKGPIVVAIDTSGSMEGEREAWSKAVAVSLLEIASIQKRNFAVVFFDTKPFKVIEIEKGKATPTQILDIAETFSYGGTSFEPVLTKCSELMNKSKFKEADLVFITDGEDNISNEFKKRFNRQKEDKEFKVISVVISGTASPALHAVSDEVKFIYDLAKDSEDVNKLNHELFSTI